jgi:hypothetical protein
MDCCKALMDIRKDSTSPSINDEISAVFRVLAQRGAEEKKSYGVLEFVLPEEQVEFNQACEVGKFFSVLWEFSEWLRQRYKHKSAPRGAFKEHEETRAAFYKIMEDEDLSLDG